MNKKSSKKTLEELLDKALIQEDEQPYELPPNWVWVKLESVCDYIQRGKSPKYSDESRIRVISQKCIQWSGLDLSVARSITEDSLSTYKEERILRKNDLLWNSTGTGTIGRVARINEDLEEVTVADSHVTVVRPNKLIGQTSFLYRWLASPFVQNGITGNSSGSTNQIELSLNSVKNHFVPLPPLPEQKRTVERVELLLGKIDEAKQLIEQVKETFVQRRAAILDAAFTGKLTEKWRDKNLNVGSAKELYKDIHNENPNLQNSSELNLDELHDLPEKWIWTTVGQLFHVQVGSTPSRKVELYWNGELPWVSSGEVKFNRITNTREKVTLEAAKKCRLKLAPKGSVVFGMIGEGKTRGQVAILDIEAYHNQNVASIWVGNTPVYPEFVYYWLLSQYERNRAIGSGNNQPAYNKSRVQSLPLPLPPIEEQREILSALNRVLEKEEEFFELVKMGDSLDVLSQSILSKAFRGELGTNNPEEESSLELLKEILQEQLNN